MLGASGDSKRNLTSAWRWVQCHSSARSGGRARPSAGHTPDVPRLAAVVVVVVLSQLRVRRAAPGLETCKMPGMTSSPSPALARLAQRAERSSAHPSLQVFGVRLTYPDEARARIEVDPVPLSLRGGIGDDAIVNGGVLSALCDLLIGSTVALVDPEARGATVQLSIRFERPLRGSAIRGEARVDHHTGRTVFASAEICDELGRACVRCQGLATLIRRSASSA